MFHTLTVLCFKSYFSLSLLLSLFLDLVVCQQMGCYKRVFSHQLDLIIFKVPWFPSKGTASCFSTFPGTKEKAIARDFSQATEGFQILFIHLFFTVMLKLYYRAALRNTQCCLNCCCWKEKLCRHFKLSFFIAFVSVPCLPQKILGEKFFKNKRKKLNLKVVFNELRHICWNLTDSWVDTGWKKEKPLVSKKEKGEQSEMRSCNQFIMLMRGVSDS